MSVLPWQCPPLHSAQAQPRSWGDSSTTTCTASRKLCTATSKRHRPVQPSRLPGMKLAAVPAAFAHRVMMTRMRAISTPSLVTVHPLPVRPGSALRLNLMMRLPWPLRLLPACTLQALCPPLPASVACEATRWQRQQLLFLPHQALCPWRKQVMVSVVAAVRHLAACWQRCVAAISCLPMHPHRQLLRL